MARIVVPKTVLTGPYPSVGAKVAPQAADTVNLQSTPATGREIIMARNTDASSHNVSVTSVPDFQGRTQHITLDPVPAGQDAYYGPFATSGWQQADGNLYFSADSALVKFVVLQLP